MYSNCAVNLLSKKKGLHPQKDKVSQNGFCRILERGERSEEQF